MARDNLSLGIRNERAPLPNVISGGQPTDAQLRAARDKGFRTVINLRAAGEEGVDTARSRVEALGMTYVWIPVAGSAGLTVENARAMMAALQSAKSPTLLHCASGNRIGALFALHAFHGDGKTADEAIRIGKAAGMTRAESVIRERLVR